MNKKVKVVRGIRAEREQIVMKRWADDLCVAVLQVTVEIPCRTVAEVNASITLNVHRIWHVAMETALIRALALVAQTPTVK